jgi:arylsulfatase A-like enzyme
VTETDPQFQGTIAVDIRDAQPDWTPYRATSAPEGAPNVLYLLWDDVGFATCDCFGGLVDMPNMRRVADNGIRLTQFHTTALCSPTRAALLTGRNATTVGMASVENLAQGFPGHNGRIPAQTALISEVLAERGWSTYAVGKWHVGPLEECHAAGSREHWPLGRGFSRYYGFLDGMTDQWYPDLVRDNHPIDPPATPEQGYHLSKDLADKAIGFLRDHRAAAPGKPWFLYFCPGAGHSPHQVATEWADRYRGVFDMGYERYRDIVLANQKALGLLPADTELSPMNPYADATSADGLPWPPAENVLPWDTLSDNEKRVSARMAEVFAGFLSYTDAQIGRVLDHLEETGQLDNTIVVIMSDNGASGEGGPSGRLHELIPMGGADETADDLLRMYDELGGPGTQMNYSNGWAMAFNTPYKLFKRYASHEGGIADPCLIAWPAGLPARGELRDNYSHVCDVTPTVYELLSIAEPEIVNGIPQAPMEGTSFAATLRDPGVTSQKDTQFYSMAGTRGIWQRGWFANTVHPPSAAAPRGWSQFDRDTWELFHLDADRSQCHDLAAEHQDKLGELIDLWQDCAERQLAYPLNDLSVTEIIMRAAANAAAPAPRAEFYPDTPAQRTPMTGLIRGRSFALRMPVRIDDTGAQGVLISFGTRAAGQALFLDDARLRYVCTVGGTEQSIVADRPMTLGPHIIELRFARTGGVDGGFDVIGDARLAIDDDPVGEMTGMRLAGLDLLQKVSVGRSVVHPVSATYGSPFEFRGGDLGTVTLDFDGPGAVHLKAVVDTAFARD